MNEGGGGCPAAALGSCRGLAVGDRGGRHRAAVLVIIGPGGRLLLSTLNRTPAAFALAIVGAEYAARLLPKGTHDYRSFIKPSELATSLRSIGFGLLDISGLSYNPLSKKVSISTNASVNYLMCAEKPND